MLDEKISEGVAKNNENDIREIQEDEYMEMLNEEEIINYIREIQEDKYRMENEMLNEEEIRNYIRKRQEDDNMEILNERKKNEEERRNYIRKLEEENIRKKIQKHIVCYVDRKDYENEKLRYQINNIYRKCGLKINK